MKLTHEQHQIYKVLRIFLKHWGAGLLPFMSLSDEMPDNSVIAEMLAAEYGWQGSEYVAVQGGDRRPVAQILAEKGDVIGSVIRNNGGLELWRKVFAEFRKVHPTEWNVLKDLSRKKRAFDIPNYEEVAYRNNISVGTVHKIRKEWLQCIATTIYDRTHDFELRGE